MIKRVEYIGSYIKSTDRGVNIRIAKACTTLNSIQSLWKSKLSEGLKRNCFRAAVESVFVYVSVTWTLTHSKENKIDGAYTRMLRAVTNTSWRDHLTNEQLYGGIPKISKYEYECKD